MIQYLMLQWNADVIWCCVYLLLVIIEWHKNIVSHIAKLYAVITYAWEKLKDKFKWKKKEMNY